MHGLATLAELLMLDETFREERSGAIRTGFKCFCIVGLESSVVICLHLGACSTAYSHIIKGRRSFGRFLSLSRR